MKIHPKVTAATLGALLVAVLVILGVNLTPEEASGLATALAFIFGWLTPSPTVPPATGATGATGTQTRRIP